MARTDETRHLARIETSAAAACRGGKKKIGEISVIKTIRYNAGVSVVFTVAFLLHARRARSELPVGF